MKSLRWFSLLILPVVLLAVLLLPGLALAQDSTDNVTPPVETLPPPDKISLSTEYPKIEAVATSGFDFFIKMSYEGQGDRIFDLDATVPNGWSVTITPQYDTKVISSITMEKPTFGPTTKTVKVSAGTPSWPLADPGEYTVTFTATSGDVSAKIDLTPTITARYAMSVSPSNQLYSTQVKAGKDNTYSVTVTNMGTAPITEINFSASKPSGWEVTYQPEKIDTLEILDPRTVDIDIKPPSDTVAGDYMITLRIAGKQAYASSLDIRVTVVTPSIWGWVGVIIIVVVVIGLVIVFMRFGRR
jgi:uncharacterized repeat protein (TIGR01451 family)